MNILDNLCNHLSAEKLPDAVQGLSVEAERAFSTGDFDHYKKLCSAQSIVNNVFRFSAIAVQSIIPEEHLSAARGEWRKEEPADNRSILTNAALAMRAEYLDTDTSSLREQLQSIEKECTELWKRIVPNEDTVTPEQLRDFYTTCGERNRVGQIPAFANASLATALRGWVGSIAPSFGNSLFDYGGGDGVVTSIAAKCGIERTVLIDANPHALEFAKWRDQKLNINNVEYYSDKDVDSLNETFDFGVSMETMEHVYDPPETARTLAGLLKKDGILFQTTSFHIYPYPSHLKKNVQYSGREDELMASVGMTRVNVSNIPVPMLATRRFYKKIAPTPQATLKHPAPE